MATQATTPTGLLDNLIICQPCGGPMTAREDHQGLTFISASTTPETLPTGAKAPESTPAG